MRFHRYHNDLEHRDLEHHDLSIHGGFTAATFSICFLLALLSYHRSSILLLSLSLALPFVILLVGLARPLPPSSHKPSPGHPGGARSVPRSPQVRESEGEPEDENAAS